ncbi:MAG: rhomboid family intramembrane serine protease [Deltaproteobacteria bacterium]|nr:rhomboid family intramembrane serine protease [Deltaproteobacteria bacterium]
MKVRKTQGAILCPGCKRLIDADEPECPHCGLKHPGMFGFGHVFAKLFGGKTDLVAGILITCVALYGASLALDWKHIGFGGMFSLLSPSGAALYTFGMTGGDAWRLGHWWTMTTATFLHGGLIHLAFNMLWLRLLGPTVMLEMGPARFIVAFVLTGITGALVGNLYGVMSQGVPYPSIGASGAVFGLMGVLITFGRRRGGAWGRQLSRKMAAWALIAFVFGFVMPNVNNAAHFGGALGGIILGYLLPRFDRAREGATVQIFAIILLVGSALGMIASIIQMWPRYFG